MANKTYNVALASGEELPINAASLDEDNEQLVFRSDNGDVIAAYSKKAVQGWRLPSPGGLFPESQKVMSIIRRNSKAMDLWTDLMSIVDEERAKAAQEEGKAD